MRADIVKGVDQDTYPAIRGTVRNILTVFRCERDGVKVRWRDGDRVKGKQLSMS